MRSLRCGENTHFQRSRPARSGPGPVQATQRRDREQAERNPPAAATATVDFVGQPLGDRSSSQPLGDRSSSWLPYLLGLVLLILHRKAGHVSSFECSRPRWNVGQPHDWGPSTKYGTRVTFRHGGWPSCEISCESRVANRPLRRDNIG